MEGRPAADASKDQSQRFVILHQEGTGGGADKNLDPRCTRKAFKIGQISDVLAGSTNPEGVIA